MEIQLLLGLVGMYSYGFCTVLFCDVLFHVPMMWKQSTRTKADDTHRSFKQPCFGPQKNKHSLNYPEVFSFEQKSWQSENGVGKAWHSHMIKVIFRPSTIFWICSCVETGQPSCCFFGILHFCWCEQLRHVPTLTSNLVDLFRVSACGTARDRCSMHPPGEV